MKENIYPFIVTELWEENQRVKSYFDLKLRRNVEPGQINLLCAVKRYKQDLERFTLISLQCFKQNVMNVSQL